MSVGACSRLLFGVDCGLRSDRIILVVLCVLGGGLCVFIVFCIVVVVILVGVLVLVCGCVLGGWVRKVG